MNPEVPSTGIVVAVCRSETHTLRKTCQNQIRLLAGQGVEGDAHLGTTVQHLSRVAVNPNQPNLRQVHLIHEELHNQLRVAGFAVAAGIMGENITVRGVDLLGLPTATRLHLGASAVIEITGLRNPCKQLDSIQQGLMAAVLGRDERGDLVRKAGVMGIVVSDGLVRPGDMVRVELPSVSHRPLCPV
jgi:MOSC domain-containing protein YiiM